MSPLRDSEPSPRPITPKSAASGTFLAVRSSREPHEPDDTDLEPAHIEAGIASCRRMVHRARVGLTALARQRDEDLAAIEKAREALVHVAPPAWMSRIGTDLEALSESIHRSRTIIDQIGEQLVALHADSAPPGGDSER